LSCYDREAMGIAALHPSYGLYEKSRDRRYGTIQI
jgi:hypothetical protein